MTGAAEFFSRRAHRPFGARWQIYVNKKTICEIFPLHCVMRPRLHATLFADGRRRRVQTASCALAARTAPQHRKQRPAPTSEAV
ncbi:hypothetical protein HMPREF9123_0346 [Neisseria bacilliformis ATCC BAA-1200]|uniref:Uncharacterized protein n=1 Tax=Neisseria bacilliformis ATCC BAA-1200 TaxID=888742 RepID=F2B9J0_9NEIS|nr:hypothetical protein HMPREF9123_0346 [Neisseria bacilliformis ATCC BAA-1200]